MSLSSAVTLNGIVRSEREKHIVQMKAQAIAGKGRVTDELEMQPKATKAQQKVNTMRILLVMISLVVVAASGCNNPEPPDQVAQDVAAAQQKAVTKIEQARQDAAKNAGDEAQRAGESPKTLNNSDAQGTYDTAIAKAEGQQHVELEKCLALAGEAQRACKDLADAHYDLAKDYAKAAHASQKQ